jgi:O-antigen biosynthesis protein WbqP
VGSELFLISDGDDIALNDLLCQVSSNLHPRAIIFRVPLGLLEAALRVLGGQDLVNHLLRPMRIDITKARTLLGWRPPYSAYAGINLSINATTKRIGQMGHPKRIMDLVGSLFLISVFALPMALIALLVRVTSPGPILYWSDRVGVNNQIFKMPKFRTMKVGTPTLATHLLASPDAFLTPIGSFLRRSSLDELTQLWCIVKGEMSIVGPRPALFNQLDLLELRARYGVHLLVPGITGWAQVNGRDKLSTEQKVRFDTEYLQKQSVYFDMKILLLTLIKIVKRDGITH